MYSIIFYEYYHYRWLRTGIQYSIIEVAKMFSDNYVLIPEQRGNRTESSGNMEKMAELSWEPKNNLKDYVYNTCHNEKNFK